MSVDPFAIGPRYGIIHECECDLVDEITARLKAELGELRFLEIGIYGGNSARGMYRRGHDLRCPVHCAGVDLVKYNDPIPGPGYEFYQGDSLEMWKHIKGTFNLLFIDAWHDLLHPAMDLLNYQTFLVPNGYLLMHDTMSTRDFEHKPEIPIWKQGPSDPNDMTGARHGVREALWKIGLLQGHRNDWQFIREVLSNEHGMGMMAFKKLKAL